MANGDENRLSRIVLRLSRACMLSTGCPADGQCTDAIFREKTARTPEQKPKDTWAIDVRKWAFCLSKNVSNLRARNTFVENVFNGVRSISPGLITSKSLCRSGRKGFPGKGLHRSCSRLSTNLDNRPVQTHLGGSFGILRLERTSPPRVVRKAFVCLTNGYDSISKDLG
jgi:hypothetical protein